MRYISLDELRLINLAVAQIDRDEWDEDTQTYVEQATGDTFDRIVVNGIVTLKYSNVLLIGVKPDGIGS